MAASWTNADGKPYDPDPLRDAGLKSTDGCTEYVKHATKELAVSENAALLMCVLHDFSAYLDGSPVVPLEGVKTQLGLYGLPREALDPCLAELELKGLVVVDPNGWASWKAEQEGEIAFHAQGPTKFLATLEYFHYVPPRYATAEDVFRGRARFDYVELLPKPGSRPDLALSPSVELLDEFRSAEDWVDNLII